MFHGRLICLYNGRGDEAISSIQNAVEQLTDNIHIIRVGDIDRKRFHLTDCIYKEYHYPLKNTTEIEGMSLLNLSENEIMTFSFRLHYLKKEMNRMEESDNELCELKCLLQYLQDENYESMTFMDQGGKVVATFTGAITLSLFSHDRKDRAQRLIKSMTKDFEEGKEIHDQDPGVSDSLMKNMQTPFAATVEQESVDVYFDSLRENISEFWEVEFYRKLLKFNKEGKKWSQPKVTWPTSKSFCILKAFMSEGTNADWVKHRISRQPEEHEQDFRSYDKLKFVIKSLLNDIEEENWAVAVLLAVADVLERFETVSANRIDCLLLLEEMFRLAQYTIQVKPGLWRKTKTLAIALIVANSFWFCNLIDPSKFAGFEFVTVDQFKLQDTKKEIINTCDTMAKAITEGLGNESGSQSHLEETCDSFTFYGLGGFSWYYFRDFLE